MLRPDPNSSPGARRAHAPASCFSSLKDPIPQQVLVGKTSPLVARGRGARYFLVTDRNCSGAVGALAGDTQEESRPENTEDHSRRVQGPVDLRNDPQRGVDLGVHGGHHAHHDDEPTGGTRRVHASDDAILKRQAPRATSSSGRGCLQQATMLSPRTISPRASSCSCRSLQPSLPRLLSQSDPRGTPGH